MTLTIPSSRSGLVLKTGDTMTGPLVIGGGTVTVSTPVLNLTQTWNNGAVAFVADTRNVTDMASSGSSLYVDWKRNSSSIFKIDKAGVVYLYNALSFGGSGDTLLSRGAARTLDLRNGANAQTFRTFGTYTDGSNYRVLTQTMTTGGAATINASGLGTGVSGNTLALSANDTSLITLSTGITLGGTVFLGEGYVVHFGTTSGNRLGNTTSQKIGFWGSTPIVQPSGTGETVGFTAGAGTPVLDDSTFTGNVGSTAYRINDIVKALKNMGLLAQ